MEIPSEESSMEPQWGAQLGKPSVGPSGELHCGTRAWSPTGESQWGAPVGSPRGELQWAAPVRSPSGEPMGQPPWGNSNARIIGISSWGASKLLASTTDVTNGRWQTQMHNTQRINIREHMHQTNLPFGPSHEFKRRRISQTRLQLCIPLLSRTIPHGTEPPHMGWRPVPTARIIGMIPVICSVLYL